MSSAPPIDIGIKEDERAAIAQGLSRLLADTYTLYLRGRAIEGSWRKDQGIAFTSAQGEIIDLAPFNTWVVMTRNYQEHLAKAQE